MAVFAMNNVVKTYATKYIKKMDSTNSVWDAIDVKPLHK